MPLNYLDVTNQLIGKRARLLPRVAAKLGVSELVLRQARVKPDKYSGIRPPAGWEKAVLAVAQEYLAEYTAFVQELREEVIKKI